MHYSRAVAEAWSCKHLRVYKVYSKGPCAQVVCALAQSTYTGTTLRPKCIYYLGTWALRLSSE